MSARRRRNKAARRALTEVLGLSRDEARERAQAIATTAAKRLPPGARIVVVVTDVSGEWIGVGNNTNPKDVEAILHSALFGADKISVPSSIIDVQGEEA